MLCHGQETAHFILLLFRIQLPDPNDTSCRKSTITIQGSIEAAVTAKVYLLVSN